VLTYIARCGRGGALLHSAHSGRMLPDSSVLVEIFLWQWLLLLRNTCVRALTDIARCGRSRALLRMCSEVPSAPVLRRAWGAHDGCYDRRVQVERRFKPADAARLGGLSRAHARARAARSVKQYHQRSAQYDQILKKNEQMHALVAITLALCPAAQRQLDENVFNTLRDKCAGVGLG
jgi:hypothetical protein